MEVISVSEVYVAWCLVLLNRMPVKKTFSDSPAEVAWCLVLLERLPVKRLSRIPLLRSG